MFCFNLMCIYCVICGLFALSIHDLITIGIRCENVLVLESRAEGEAGFRVETMPCWTCPHLLTGFLTEHHLRPMCLRPEEKVE